MSDAIWPSTNSNLAGLATQVIGRARLIDNSGSSWTDGEWWQQLQPGSWRGVGFVLDAGPTAVGRRIALHEYPYRDDAWAEDLGKLPRRFGVQAFLTGPDVYQQRDAMLRACEQSGPGTLVHPTLGSIQCVLLQANFTDRRERGRYVEVMLTFIVSGDVQYPTTSIAIGNAIAAATSALNLASKGDLGATLDPLGTLPGATSASVPQFSALATSAANDPTRILGAVRGLPGIYGRFSTGSLATLQPSTMTVQGALAGATTARSAVYSAAAQVNTLASRL